MKISYLFLAEGFEEIEALTVVDMMRRAGMEIRTVSITDEKIVSRYFCIGRYVTERSRFRYGRMAHIAGRNAWF